MSNEPWDRKWETSEKALLVLFTILSVFGGIAYYQYKEKQIRDDFLKKHSQEIMNLASVKNEQLKK